MDDVIVAMEDAFAAASNGDAESVGVLHIDAGKYGGGWSIKPGYLKSRGYVGVKLACGYPGNAAKGIPTIMGAILLADAKDGTPLLLIDGLYVTAIRTGATGGVAAKHLARKEAEIVGVVGAGTQGRMQVRSLKRLFSLEEIKAYDIDKSRLRSYVREMAEELGVKVTEASSAREAVQGSDIVITVTPSKTPYVKSEWLQGGVHVNAFGADRLGKQELDKRIYKRSKLVTDDINAALQKKLFTKDDVYAELGEVITGKKKGRTRSTDLTVFDSTGVGIQDVATAAVAYERAKKSGAGQTIRLN